MRTALRLLLATVFAVLPALLGTVAALLYTGAGAVTLGRVAGEELTRRFRGSFTLARVDGSFLHGVDLHELVIRDTLGEPFAEVERLRVGYQLPNLIAKRFVFADVELLAPDLRVIRRSSGRYNYEEIFRLKEGPPGGAPGPLIEVRDLTVRGGRVEIRLPWKAPDSLTTQARRDSALQAERAKPGREIRETPDGLRRIIRLEALDARIARLLLSSPKREPFTFSVDSLRTEVSDPAVSVVDLAADGWQRADTLAFELHRAALPDTRVQGGGRLTWPRGPILYDFQLTSSRVNLEDLRWISPDFPAMTGTGAVVADSRGDLVTAYQITSLELAGRQGRIRGDVTVVLDQRRGLGVEGMALDLLGLDLDVPRPYLDTIPFEGTLTGRLEGDGYIDGIQLRTDISYTDAEVEGGADTRFRSHGHLRLDPPLGLRFDTLTLDSSDVDLRTVQRISPAVKLNGRLLLTGTLAGPWKNVTFEGDLAHHDADHPESRATGLARLDTRTDTVGFDARLAFAPLAFEGIRPSYPGIPIRGSADGRVAVVGTPDNFEADVDLSGRAGRVAFTGTVQPGTERLYARGVTGRFEALDLAELLGRGPATRLQGTLALDGSYDSLGGPIGSLALDLGPGRVREVSFDTLHARAHGDSQAVLLDTLLLGWTGGRLGGSGRIGWRTAQDGRILLAFEAESLTHFDSLVTTYAGAPSDSTAAAEPLMGRARGEVEVLGTLTAPRLLARGRGRDVRWRGVFSPELAMSFGWQQGTRPEIGGALRSDTILVGRWLLEDLDVVVGGWQDSLRWLAGGRIGPESGISGAGSLWRLADSSRLTVDSLVLRLPDHNWRISEPVTIGLGTGQIKFSRVAIEATDGSGAITVAGDLPRREAGNLEVSLIGLPLRDVYSLLQRDTTGVAGTIQVDLTIGGTAREPTFRGTGALADLSFGDFGAPFVQGIIDYADRRLDASILLWKTGQPVLRVEADLPLDLALQAVPKRQMPGPLAVRITADSTDLGVAEAFTRNVRRVRGMLRADVEVGGTWDTPRLGGTIEVRDAEATVPGLGVRYEDVGARARLMGDSILIDSLIARSGEGTVRVGGHIRLEHLTRPVLDLTLRARRFRAIDARRFLTLDASGTLALEGPLRSPRLTGRVTADEGNLHFADLITKRIVDLENPGDSGLIDLNLVRAERLGANFQSRFLDSLTIDGLRVQMGESFWLRSGEANIQLDGEMTVAKVRDLYRYDGTLNAIRGDYVLRIGGLVTREFRVTRGTVRYFGTPDLNAELNIEATHLVVAAGTNEEIPITAKITGTLLQPKLELYSAPTSDRPSLSQTELVSYLMFGRPTFSLQSSSGQGGSQFAAVQAGLSYLTSAFSSEIQRALVSDLGVPIDYIDIRTGSGGSAGLSGGSNSAQLAQVAAGWQIGRRWFVTLVADLCTNTQRFYPNAEFRVSRELRIKGSIEPSYSCQTSFNQPTLSVNRYQVGLDLLWEREF